MPGRRPRPSAPGALAFWESGEPMSAPARFIVTLKDETGIGIAATWISVHLDGSGLLRPEGASDAKTFTFQRTDDLGVIQLTWLPGKGTPPGPIALRASAATSGRLTVRRL